MIICMGCMNKLNTNTPFCPICGYDMRQKPLKSYFLDPGTILQNRYLIGKSLGNGGFGITYIGYDIKLERRCAIKEFYPRDVSERQSGQLNVYVYDGNDAMQFNAGLESFLDEAKRLGHFTDVPQVVNVYDSFRANSTGYIVMEYIDGRTAGDYLKSQGPQGRIPWQEALTLVKEVLKGLIPVHNAGMMHRDIAPVNIMIDREGKIKLIDFGASRQMIASRTQNYDVILKPGYAPVEQYSSRGRQGPWTDVYAVAATFYRMVTGEKPPNSLDRREQEPLRPPSRMGVPRPPAIERVIMQALAIRPENRIQSAAIFLAMLEQPNERGPIPEPEPFGDGDSDSEELTAKDYVLFVLAFLLITAVTAALVYFILGAVLG